MRAHGNGFSRLPAGVQRTLADLDRLFDAASRRAAYPPPPPFGSWKNACWPAQVEHPYGLDDALAAGACEGQCHAW